MNRFEEYETKYPDIRMERKNGISQMTFQTDGGSLIWAEDRAHRDFGNAFADVGSDPQNKVVIMTGAGDSFINDFAKTEESKGEEEASRLGSDSIGRARDS